jgi:hypothetical protein
MPEIVFRNDQFRNSTRWVRYWRLNKVAEISQMCYSVFLCGHAGGNALPRAFVAAQGRLGHASIEGRLACSFCGEKLVKVLCWQV